MMYSFFNDQNSLRSHNRQCKTSSYMVGVLILIFTTLTPPSTSQAARVYNYEATTCDGSDYLYYYSCDLSTSWVFSDNAFDDGVATGASEILDFDALYTLHDAGNTFLASFQYSDLIDDINTLEIYGNSTVLTGMSATDSFVNFENDSGRLDMSFSYLSLNLNVPVDYNTYYYASGGNWEVAAGSSPTPVPAAVWLFGSGLLGLIGFARQKRVHRYE